MFFGSARFHSRETAEAELRSVQEAGVKSPEAEEIAQRAKRTLTMSSTTKTPVGWRSSSAKWTRRLHSLGTASWCAPAAGPASWKRPTAAPFEAGAKTIGLNINLPFEQVPNPYITPELNFEFHYFFMRKLWFAYLAKALVVFPGGSAPSTRCSNC